jgi:hypothetical protein
MLEKERGRRKKGKEESECEKVNTRKRAKRECKKEQFKVLDSDF